MLLAVRNFLLFYGSGGWKATHIDVMRRPLCGCCCCHSSECLCFFLQWPTVGAAWCEGPTWSKFVPTAGRTIDSSRWMKISVPSDGCPPARKPPKPWVSKFRHPIQADQHLHGRLIRQTPSFGLFLPPSAHLHHPRSPMRPHVRSDEPRDSGRILILRQRLCFRRRSRWRRRPDRGRGCGQ